jgi:ferric-chelate reductase (NADPH)
VWDRREEDKVDRPDGPPNSEGGWLVRRFYRPSTVVRVEEPAEGYRVLTFGGERLKGVAWAPGQKIQIATGGGSNRAYTPMVWDSARGETRILAFLHSEGPGSRWASRTKVGDACFFTGPRRSLELSALGKRTFLFGDETSMGLAVALRSIVSPSDTVSCVFEVSSVPASQRAWQAFGPGDATFVQRRDGDRQLDEVESHTRRIFDSGPPTGFVLTGKVSSIQHVRGLLKALGVETSRLRVKAYWAPGKTGLD